MAQRLFQVEGGFSDGHIHYLSGEGPPGGDGSYHDAAPQGSVYVDSLNHAQYHKKTTNNAVADWLVTVKSERFSKELDQVAHGFAVGDWLYRDASGVFAKAQSNDINTTDTIGIVNSVIDVDTFELVSSGFSDVVTAISEGAALFLSPSEAGAFMATKPVEGIQKNLGFVVEGKVFVGIDLSVELSSDEAPGVPLFITEDVTTITIVAQVMTQEANGAMWLLEANSATGRYQSVVHATHDAAGGAATLASFSEFAMITAGTEITGLAIGASVNGIGDSQTLDLTVVATDTVQVSVRQIKV